MARTESHLSELPLPLFEAAEGLAQPIRSAPGRPVLPHLRDHRKRLRARFMDWGPAALADYEMLELVLFRAIAREDVAPLAYHLLERFGDFNGVVSADPARLREVPDVTDAVVQELKIVAAAAQRLARARVINRCVISSWDALLDYCHTAMAHRDVERFHVLFLDNLNTLIADEEQGRGTVNHVPVYPREVAKRALELNASALILVHNHPSGDPTPSDNDIIMTRRVHEAAAALDITLHDHLIIGKSCELSFRDAGLL